ncbi:MAG: hypothetical protein QXJ75_05075 [Candidatus Bathyarchaeia archaeon]
MLRNLRLLLLVMVSFWGVFMAGSWIVANIYLPWVKAISGASESLLVDFLAWSVVVVLIAVILLAFKHLLHAIFWREMAYTQRRYS